MTNQIVCNGPCKRTLDHTEENFHILRQQGKEPKLRIRCKQCHGLSVKKWQKNNPDFYENYQKGWVKQDKAANPEKWQERQWIQDLKKMNATPEWFLNKLTEQNSVCAICGEPEIEIHPQTQRVMRLAMDHDHRCCRGDKSCGECLRGLLCAKCNQSLHKVEKTPHWLYRASDYLEKYKK